MIVQIPRMQITFVACSVKGDTDSGVATTDSGGKKRNSPSLRCSKSPQNMLFRARGLRSRLKPKGLAKFSISDYTMWALLARA